MVKKMIEKHKECKRKLDNSAFIICSFCGAIHGDLNVVLFKKDHIKKSHSAQFSANMLNGYSKGGFSDGFKDKTKF